MLDEATSSLDSTSEAAVQAALDEALAGRTALVIAHRLSTIRPPTSIVVMDHGRIVERGRHDELLLLDGRYAELVSHPVRACHRSPAGDGDGRRQVDLRGGLHPGCLNRSAFPSCYGPK